MNGLDEQQLVSRAAHALEQLIGRPVKLAGDAFGELTGASSTRDVTLWVGPNAFRVEAKASLHPSTAGLLAPSRRGERLPVVVVATYVSPAVGQQLRQRGICYLDTVGNTFLQADAPDLFIFLQGQRPPAAQRPDKGRAFRPTGLRLIYHLLNNPELLRASYRELADKANLSLGSVSAVLHDLRQLGLLREEEATRRWLDAPQVLRRWVEGYGEMLRPRLAAQRYRWLNAGLGRDGWRQLALGIDCFWGGEPAANLLLDGHLLPEQFTLYSSVGRGELMRRFQLVPDAKGAVEVLTPFETTYYQYRPQERAVSPLLTYADLLLSADPRNREVAHLLHARYLSYLA